MAGRGQRFVDEGFVLPKPLIDIDGRPMIQHAIESLGFSANYIFIKRSYGDPAIDDTLDALLRTVVKQAYNSKDQHCHILTLDEPTEGAACTCLLAEDLINNDEALIIANCDQIMSWNAQDFVDYLNRNKPDGAVVTYFSRTEKNSYIKVNDDGWGIEVAEKKVISDHSLNGIHFWRKGSDFVSSAKKMIKDDERTNGEFYISTTYNVLIESGKKIGIFEVSEKNHHSVGTPDDLKSYLELKKLERGGGTSVDWFVDKFDYGCRVLCHMTPMWDRNHLPLHTTQLQKHVALNFIDNLERATAFRGIRKQGDRAWTDLMGHARFMHEKIDALGCLKGLELGTGSGQGFNTLILSLRPGGHVYTCDTRLKNIDLPKAMLDRYATRGFVNFTFYHTYSTNDDFVSEVMNDNVKVDVLFVDSDHTRKNVIKELLTWLPHLSENAVVFFHDTLWCHDMVKVLLDEIVDGFKTYKFCRDFDISKYTLEHMNIADYADCTAGIDPETMRPTIQDKSPHAAADAPEYAKDIRINPDDYSTSDDGYDAAHYHLKYEMLLAWPGMIALEKSPDFSWSRMRSALVEIAKKDGGHYNENA